MGKLEYKDPRYTTVKLLLHENAIPTFSDIFTYLPYTIVARDLHINNNRMKLLKDSVQYNADVIERLADIIGCDVKKLARMAEFAYIKKHGTNPSTQ